MCVEILGFLLIPVEQQTVSQLFFCHDELSALRSCYLLRLSQAAEEWGWGLGWRLGWRLCQVIEASRSYQM
jgi:hypothetical protein